MTVPLDRRGEDAAASFALARGARVVARNWRGGRGEIDLVLEDGPVLAFAEVKTRSSARFGTPAEAVTPAKVRKLTRAALAYLAEHGLEDKECRFDLFSVETRAKGKLEVAWEKGAFEAAPEED